MKLRYKNEISYKMVSLQPVNQNINQMINKESVLIDNHSI